MIGRRSFITGLVSLVAAPAIVRAGSLMPVKLMSPSEVNDAVRRMMVDMAERQVNPPWMAFDFDVAIGDIIKIMGIPHKMLAKYP